MKKEYQDIINKAKIDNKDDYENYLKQEKGKALIEEGIKLYIESRLYNGGSKESTFISIPKSVLNMTYDGLDEFKITDFNCEIKP